MGGTISGIVAYWKAGGFYMWPLTLCIILAATFIVERFITYRLVRIDIKKFMNELKNSIRGGDIEKGIEYCNTVRSPVARIMESALKSYRKVGPHRDAVEEAMVRAGSAELAFLDRGLPWLAAVTTVAPIIGFLGTVSGMIHAFQAVAIAGEVEPTLVASGISEALVTTATGLAIAFPTVMFHVYFQGCSNNYTRMMEEAAADLVTFLMEEKP